MVKNITGKVYINGTAEAYYREFTDNSYLRIGSQEPLHVEHQVKDYLRLEVVKNLDIHPKYKSIYMTNKGNSFSFKIQYGSGHYNVNINNTAIAEMQHREGIVTITPKQEGSL
jgi:hypothetical protein